MPVLERDLAIADLAGPRAGEKLLSGVVHLNAKNQWLLSRQFPNQDLCPLVAVGDGRSVLVVQVPIVVPGKASEEPVEKDRFSFQDGDGDNPAVAVDDFDCPG